MFSIRDRIARLLDKAKKLIADKVLKGTGLNKTILKMAKAFRKGKERIPKYKETAARAQKADEQAVKDIVVIKDHLENLTYQ